MGLSNGGGVVSGAPRVRTLAGNTQAQVIAPCMGNRARCCAVRSALTMRSCIVIFTGGRVMSKQTVDKLKDEEAARLCEIKKLKKQLRDMLRPGECVYIETKPVRGELRRV